VERAQQQDRERKSREDRATGNDDSFRRYGKAWTEPNTGQTTLQYKAQFAGASGLITSNFSLSGTRGVIDNHFGLIFVL
jgi:hypothetical protein